MLPKTFCVLPWINLSTDVNGSLRPCCKFAQPSKENEFQLPNMRDGSLDQLWNHSEFKRLRRAFLEGQQPKECQSCWQEEAAGHDSFRTSFTQFKHIDTDQVEFGIEASQGPKALDLKLNNVCNLKCRICGPQASSTFLKETNERFNIKLDNDGYWLSNKILNTKNEQVLQEWAKDLSHIEITGGEPMASPENIKILEILIASGHANHINLVANTNGTLFNQKFIDCLKCFRHVIILLSIDDIGPRLEYQRFPSDWSVIQTNLQKYKQLILDHNNIEIFLNPTISIFNVYHLDQYQEWAKEMGLTFYINFLHYDPVFCIKNLPVELKRIVMKKLKNNNLDVVRNFIRLPSDPTISIIQTQKNIQELDQFRNQSFEKTFDYWGKILMSAK